MQRRIFGGYRSVADFHVPDMSCGHCKAAIEKAFAAADPSAAIEVDLKARTVRVTGRFSQEDALAIFKTAGYDAAVRS